MLYICQILIHIRIILSLIKLEYFTKSSYSLNDLSYLCCLICLFFTDLSIRKISFLYFLHWLMIPYIELCYSLGKLFYGGSFSTFNGYYNFRSVNPLWVEMFEWISVEWAIVGVFNRFFGYKFILAVSSASGMKLG